ncbi:hypothetical protein Pst134EA_011222 [Puccinia striiformis f. sp. tritici]|uniref:hypothetical protein n=1 Tax=Puccinia striiformis f. sp. tritici TaxID=168172 RepID=UPI00200736F6|nr:hypothetical protein Pst134EA_011222 [Puccinia striiformis f. sp. tritici]KAH9467582.1 hypothetical protein Pst134EA_011222 [Puccinia striiformis f. sp. tritici]
MYHIPTRRRGYLVFIILGVPILILTCYLTYRQPLSSYYPLGPINLNLGSRLGILRSTASSKDPQVVHSQDGYLYLNDNMYRNQPVIHPIISLINNATRAWNLKLASQSKDFATAVSEYRRRNNRNPPKGYDRWWTWASKNNVKLLDEYDYSQTCETAYLYKGIIPHTAYQFWSTKSSFCPYVVFQTA